MDLMLATTTLCQQNASTAINGMGDNLVVVIVLSIVGFLVFIALMVLATKTKEREKTKREVAAYVAEGSMTPEEGERLLNAGKRSCS